MLVIPAIDVSGGRLAGLRSGERVPVEAFHGEPLEAARAFRSAGATWIHAVDMDQAFTGRISDLSFVSGLADLGLSVQASGGISTPQAVRAALDAGATRVVLGSAALGDREMVEGALETFEGSLAVGLEADGDVIRPRGTRDDLCLDLSETLGWLAEVGATRLVFTQVRAVGRLSGPDRATLRSIIAAVPGIPVVVSGGISTLADLSELARDGAEGAVVGRGLYEGGLDLGEAIAACAPT